MLKTKIFFVSGTIFVLLFLLAIFLPALQGPRINYKYTHSLSNLKYIGIGLWMYAEDHNEVFPDNLEQTKVYFNKTPGILVSPIKPRDFNGPSYLYINGHSFQDAKSKEKYIIVYENPEYLTGNDPQKINVLYLEGHTDRLKKEDFLSKLGKTYEHLGKPIPEIKFKEQLPVTEAK